MFLIAADGILIFYFLSFEENKAWCFKWILSRGFTWNIKSYFLSEKQWKNIVECRLLQSWLALQGLNWISLTTSTIYMITVTFFYSEHLSMPPTHTMSKDVPRRKSAWPLDVIKSNLNGSNTFGTMKMFETRVVRASECIIIAPEQEAN